MKRIGALGKIFVAAVLGSFAVGAWAQGVIKIGEVNSYKKIPAFLGPYKKGMNLALDQVNAAGGVDGKTLKVISRDDNGNTGDAVRAAQELVVRDKVDLLAGTFLSNIGLAVADFAGHNKVFFLASEPLSNKIVWANGNHYTFRLRSSTYMQVAMLVPEAVKMHKKRWALVYPNYEYGQSAAKTFKTLMKAAQPDVQFVAEQATPLGKIDAANVVQALADAKPDAMFNALFATDLAKFVRAGSQRHFFKGLSVVSMLTGEPEYLDTLGSETPVGWVVTGYPWYAIHTPAHDKFLKAYQAKYHDYPRLGSVVGYNTIMSIAAGLKKAGSANTEALVQAFKGLKVDTPFGPIVYRALDHQSTMGEYVGTLALKDGKGIMDNFHYVSGEQVQASDADVKKWRPASADKH